MRGCSLSLSYNNSRESLAHFGILFILYIERMEIQNNNPLQADQVKSLSTQKITLSYKTLKIEKTLTNNRASKNKNITVLYDNSQDTNACQAEEFETSSISYTANQLADPNS